MKAMKVIWKNNFSCILYLKMYFFIDPEKNNEQQNEEMPCTVNSDDEDNIGLKTNSEIKFNSNDSSKK